MFLVLIDVSTQGLSNIGELMNNAMLYATSRRGASLLLARAASHVGELYRDFLFTSDHYVDGGMAAQGQPHRLTVSE